MPLLLDFLPVIAFFIAYKVADIYVATQVIMFVAPLIVGATWLLARRLRPLQALSAGLVVVFGGITLALHDSVFIMWKPTVLNWLFAAAFLVSHLRAFGDRPLVRRLMEADTNSIELEPAVWRRLNLVWVTFFGLMGLLNLVIFKTFPEAVWVNFKLWGMLGLTFVFALAQSLWIGARTRASGDSG